MQQPRFILFDAVGTLIYPQPSVRDVYAHYGQNHGATLTAAQIQARFAPAFEKQEVTTSNEALERARWQAIVADVFRELPETSALFESLWNHFAQSSHWALYPDVVETWTTLTQRGYTLGIASNFDVRLVSVCQGLPPLDHCQHLFYSSELGFPKPHPRFFAAIQERLAAEPGELLLVGDDPLRDYAGALAAGWQARRIARPAPSAADTLSDLRQLLKILA